MKPQLWIYAAAGYNVALALFHLGFWRMFRWREELAKLHPVNRGVMQVMNIMLVLTFLFFAGLQVTMAAELAADRIGRMVLAGMMLFWMIRAGLQPIFWRGQPAAMNAAFTSLFLLGAGLHALTLSPPA